MGTKLGRAAAFGYPFYVTLVSLQPEGVAGTLAPMESWAPPEQAPRPLRGAESGPEQAEAGRGPSPLGSLKAAHCCEFPGDTTLTVVTPRLAAPTEPTSARPSHLMMDQFCCLLRNDCS